MQKMDEDLILILKLLVTLQINLASLCLAWHFEKNKRWINRRWLVRPINRKRATLGYEATTFQELKKDPNLFYEVTRMNLESFNYLCRNLTPYLTKKRSNIYAEQRLLITLRYLSTGDSISSIALEHRIGESTCLKIIKETCRIIFKKLSPVYLKVPSEQEWKDIADGFLHDWNLPNCCGAIDGKHVRIRAPPNSGSLYYNYKKYFSLILLAVCNHKYEFILFDIGAVGSESDGGVFARSELGKCMREKKLNLPQNTNFLPGTHIDCPYYFVGDDAFEMTPNLMKPYSSKHLEEKQLIFNYRLSRARRIIENSFGILVSRWRFLLKPIGLHPKSVIKCVLASICLHNFLMDSTNKSRDVYCPARFIDQEIQSHEIEDGLWRQYAVDDQINDINEINFEDEVLNAHLIRDTLANYFLQPEGEVPCQYDYIHRGSYQNI